MIRSTLVRLGCGGMMLAGFAHELVSQGKYEMPPSPESAVSESEASVEKALRLSQRLASKVTIHAKDSTVRSLIEAVARQVGMRVNYSEAVEGLKRRVAVNIQSATAQDALVEILKGSGLEAKALSDGVTLVVRPKRTQTERIDTVRLVSTVSGRIVDSVTKKGIGEVAVSINQIKLGAVSNADGLFTIANVPLGEYTVTVRKFGYKSITKSITVSANKNTSVELFVMGASLTQLNEVVTTVTGQQKKLEMGNDITTINVPEVMKQAPITSVTDLLEARVPGLTVMRTSGVPGAPSRIRLRGIGGGLLAGTPGAPTNDPIVIVDGIRIYAGQTGVEDQKLGGGKYPTPSPLDQIDPNSIEKIEVLRGPSAAAMYGSDAGDGVIIISTKKGKAGAARWDIGGNYGIEYMPGKYTAPGYYRFGHQPGGIWVPGDPPPFCPTILNPQGYFTCIEDSVVRFQALNEPRLSTIGRGRNSRLTGSVSGGTSELTYSVTGSVTNALGLTKMPPLYQDLFKKLYDSAPSERMKRPNSMNGRSGQASFSWQFGRSLSATYSTSLSQTIQRQSSANDQLSSLASTYIDTLNIDPGRPGQYAYQLDAKSNSYINALAVNISRWEWLPISSTVGMDRLERSSQGLTPRGIAIVGGETWNDGSYIPRVDTRTSKGSFTERRENINTTTARIIGTVFPGSRISVTTGSEVRKTLNTSTQGQADTLTEGVSHPSAFTSASRSGRQSTTGGWFVEPRLNLNSRFFVNPGFRLDGGGVSGSSGGFRGGLLSLFPKLNFSWIAVDREGRDPLFGAISMLRPRLAFGIAGVPPGAEMSLRTLEQNTGPGDPNIPDPILSGIPDLGLRIRSVGNTRLGPEKTQEIEGGFDLQLWETRLTISATGFYKMRKNAIQQIPLPPSIGSGIGVSLRDPQAISLSYYTNIGHVRNAGGELTVNGIISENPNFGWTVDLSISKITNKLTKLYGEKKVIDLGGGTRFVEGYPLFGRWSYPLAGWKAPTNGTKILYGDYTVSDSAVYMGMQTPNFEMPFRSSMSLYRGLLTLNAQFNYKAGLTQTNIGSGTLLSNIYDNPNSTYGQQAYALAAARYIAAGSVWGSGGGGTDYGFIQKVNSLRFNSVSMGYNVPREYLKRYPISSMSLSLQGSNLGVWTNYRGKDPDVNGNLVGDATTDSGQLPMPRTWSLQVRIGM